MVSDLLLCANYSLTYNHLNQLYTITQKVFGWKRLNGSVISRLGQNEAYYVLYSNIPLTTIQLPFSQRSNGVNLAVFLAFNPTVQWPGSATILSQVDTHLY